MAAQRRRAESFGVTTVHASVPGRARIHVDRLRRCRELARWVEARLAREPAVLSASASVRTGTILIRHRPGLELPSLLDRVETAVQSYLDTSAVVDLGIAGPLPARRPGRAPHASEGAGTSAGFGVIHATVPGRARVEVSGLKGEPQRCAWLEAKLTGLRGVHRAAASPTTGRVLLHFEPELELRHVLATLAAALADIGNAGGDGELATRSRAGWHGLEIGEVAARLGTSPRHGLAAAAARQRCLELGPNVLPPPLPRSALRRLADQFLTLPVGLLGASALASVLTGGLGDAAVILAVVVINGGIGYATESRAQRTIAALDAHVRPPTLVVRGGELQQVAGESVVPGDLLVLRQGTPLVADARLVQARRLSVCEAPLTGESLPVDKTADCVLDADAPLSDRLNMVYSGTLVTGGSGLALVTASASDTEIGHIQRILERAEPPPTPMERQLERVGRQLVIVSSVVCGAVFGIGLLRGFRLVEMLKSSISLAVAAVPEGLPAVATTTLAFGVAAMRRRGVLIRRLSAVEALGATEVLCLDKTGTITQNRMSVTRIQAGGEAFAVRHGVVRVGGKPGASTPPDVGHLLAVGALCNEVDLGNGDGAFVLEGSPTETALVECAVASGIEVRGLRRRLPRLRTSLRAVGRNFMKTLHRSEDGVYVLAMKGNPGEVLALCQSYRKQNETLPLDDAARAAIRAENERMAGDSLRVLGLAFAAGAREELDGRLTWLGLVGMADPLRDGVPRLLGTLRAAGIATTMITGDQEATASAIGRALDLGGGESLRIVDASQLRGRTPQELGLLVHDADVICRASPGDKLQIVEALQAAGRVVAMTGDGVNDGPALRAADSGIAMGAGGTELARSVADAVLEHDDLSELVAAIGQGRTVRTNTRKALHFLLSTNLSEILVMLGAISFGLGQPLNPRQLLWVNLVSDVFPGLALALDPADDDVMERAPLAPDAPILSGSELRRIGVEGATLSAGALGSYAYGIARYGVGARAGSMAFLSLASGQLLHALSCRSSGRSLLARDARPRNPLLLLTVAGTLALQAVAALVPGLRGLLGTTAIGALDALVVGAGATLPLLIAEATKPRAGLPSDENRESRERATPQEPVEHHSGGSLGHGAARP